MDSQRSKQTCKGACALIHTGVLSFLLLNPVVLAAITEPPIYVVGSIPPQDVDQNATLAFQLQSPKLGTPTFTFSVDAGYPAPTGPVTLDSTSGRFTYVPTAADKFQFRITFTSTVGGNPPDFQSVLIFPRRALPPETDLLNRVDRIPDPTSLDYTLETKSVNATPEFFNGVMKPTRNVEISGKTVILQASDPAYSRLYNSYNGATDIKNLTIYAESLVVRSPLSLPGTNVKVYARNLGFEDLPSQSPASINTTPLPLGSNGTQSSNGQAGQKAGNIELWIDNFSAPGSTARLIANGGRGQDAGQGLNGLDKPAYVPPDKGSYFNITQNGSVNNINWPYGQRPSGQVFAANGSLLQPPYPSVVSVTSNRCGELIMGQPPRWPEDGNDAISPGKPGTGGPGGSIAASVQIGPGYMQFLGGASGGSGDPRSGGPPQQPVFSAWLKTRDAPSGQSCLRDHWDAEVTALHTSVAGKNAPSIFGTPGASGSSSLLPQATTAPWLHPNFLQMVMAHAKDTYRGGNMDESRRILQDYADVLDANQNPPQEYAFTFQSTRQEIQGLLTRIAGKLDYFGNTAGWVPLLSLAPYVNAFSSEVDAAIPLLYLSRWLQANSDRNAQSVAALQDGVAKLQKDIQTAQTAVRDSAAAAPNLQQRIGKITADITDLQAAIQQRESDLLAQAQRNVQDSKKVPFWKQGCRILGAVCQALPFYQPALGLAGQALTSVTNVNIDEPLPQLFNDGVSMWNQLKGITNGDTLDKSAQDWKSFVDKIDPSDATSVKDYGQGLYDVYKQKIEPKQQAVINEFKGQQISDSEVKAAFEKLRAQDSSLNDLIQRATDLQQSKASFGSELSNMLQGIAAQQTTISKDFIAKDSLQQNVASTSAQFDHKLMVAVRDLELRARDRLFRYQYYMAKAYEYRMLQQYPSDLNLDTTIKQINNLITNTYPPDPSIFTTINPTTIKSVYLTSVREIVDRSLQDSTSQSIEKQQLLKFELTPDELTALNKLPIGVDQWLPIDVSQRIGPLVGEDNRHIADIVFDQIQVQTIGPTGPFARMRVLLAHDGRSLQSLNGRQYNFYFGLRPEDTPFFWDASYDIPSGSLDQAKPSPSAIYQLISLLQLPPTSDPSVLFARLGADKVILYLRREPQPGTLNAQITKVRLAVKVDYFRRNSNLVTVSVQSGDVQPYIALDKNDVTGRADGLGNFQRTYNAGDRVTLSAEPFHGNLVFKYWSDDLGKNLGTSPTLTLNPSVAMSIHPVYAGAAPSVPLRFVPVTPCRVADTRNTEGLFGGPILSASSSRDFIIPNSTCGIPAAAQAYAMNVTVVPSGGLRYLTVWPSGQPQPTVSTLNSMDGRIKANAAIVPAGTNGAVSVFATNDTHVILDINGYFVPNTTPSSLAFYPLPPCRVVDTRSAAGPLGGPSMSAGQTRDYPVLISFCNVPTSAQAYSLNFTAVPKGPLIYVSTWPTGQTRPVVSTLNAPTGAVTANAAILPAGTNGDVSVYTTNDTDLIIDVNGYFAPPETNALSFYTLPPCRVFDTRTQTTPQPFTGTLGVTFDNSCAVPANVQSYVLNATVVPSGTLGWLTLWPAGNAQPNVSTLNAYDGTITSNMAIVPTIGGTIDAFAANPTHLILDISGYFAP